jgi:hypothetical protein
VGAAVAGGRVVVGADGVTVIPGVRALSPYAEYEETLNSYGTPFVRSLIVLVVFVVCAISEPSR